MTSTADGDTLKQAMRQIASGVSVITTGLKPARTGFTATSVISLSVEPPRTLFSVNKASSSYAGIVRSGFFAINVLAAHQQPLADRFAGRGGIKGEDRFSTAHWETLATGAPVLADALANLDGEVEEIIERHSHAIVIGRLLNIRTASPGDALIYWHGTYGQLDAPASAAAAA